MKKYSVKNDIRNNHDIAIVPVKNLRIDKKYRIKDIVIYPPDSIEIDELFTSTYNEMFSRYKTLFLSCSLIVIPLIDYKWKIINIGKRFDDRQTLLKCLEDAEEVLDVIRFVYCNFDKTSNLTSRAGYLEQGYAGILIYSKKIDAINFLIEKNLIQTDIVSTGLEIEVRDVKALFEKYFILQRKECSEVGNILKYALKQYSDVLHSENKTTKFMLAMSLIEYLANPYEYINMKKTKSKIIPFIAQNIEEIHELSERFVELTSKENEKGEQIGLRTNIIHNGKKISDLIDSEFKVDMLLREMQEYINIVIEFYYSKYDQEWSEIETLIDTRRSKIERIRRQYKYKKESDTLILIDTEFLNKVIEEIHEMYPNEYIEDLNIANFLAMICIQTNVNCNGFKIPVTFFYSDDILSHSTPSKVSDLEHRDLTQILER